MLKGLTKSSSREAVPIRVVAASEFDAFLKAQSNRTRNWLESTGVRAEHGKSCLLPGADGKLSEVLVFVKDHADPWAYARLPTSLPKRRYRVVAELDEKTSDAVALGWALGCYRFERYKKRHRQVAELVWPSRANRADVTRRVEGICLCRDLINAPANDLGPEELVQACRELAQRHGAQHTTISGNRLKQQYPAIYTVGQASSRPPLLFDMRWGNPKHPKLTLVGKGVCFDSGGLDIKTAEYMRLMKKDMGGAAAVLGLAHMLMGAKLPIRLRMLIPAVENSVSGSAFRPLDVLTTRKGITVEVGNTDAEGRLILCDALTDADSEKPDLIVDVATLTGAARVALGTSMPALFCTDDELAAAVLDAGIELGDPLWRLPFHTPYRKSLDSPIAEINNIGSSSFAGAITAALFLREFVAPERRFIHIDTMAYNLENLPGRPIGGEALGVSALYLALARRYERSQSKQ